MAENFASNQYLTFILGDETFALAIANVREVLDFPRITKVPRTPDFLSGVINLRGNVVPVIDLRQCLGMEPITRTVDTCAIIVEVDVGIDRIHLGALADNVQEVVEIQPNAIDPPPKLGTHFNTEFIKGMGKHDERFVIILDINRVLTDEQLDIVEASADLNGDAIGESDATAP